MYRPAPTDPVLFRPFPTASLENIRKEVELAPLAYCARLAVATRPRLYVSTRPASLVGPSEVEFLARMVGGGGVGTCFEKSLSDRTADILL